MSNQSVINAFMNGKCANSSNGNLRSNGDRLINYSTCIAQRLDNGKVLFNATKYSVSTSKIQRLIDKLLCGKFVKLTSVPINTRYLERYA